MISESLSMKSQSQILTTIENSGMTFWIKAESTSEAVT